MAKIHKGPVYLEPIEHIYIHKDTDERFTSVTKVLGSVEPHFDSEAVSLAISKQPDEVRKEQYRGMSQKDILREWKIMNDEANLYGTAVHELIEKYLLANKWMVPEDSFEKIVLDGYDSLGVDEGREVYTERIMFSQFYKLAGTADLMIDIDDQYFDIGDWKGLSVDTPIFTDTGWKIMGTLSKDDWVYDMNGKLTRILHLSGVKNKPCFEITFDNNETIVADEEHRWLVSFLRDKKFKDVVMTTKELHHYLDKLKNRYSHKIPKIKITKPLVNVENIDLPIDPYVLGVWLGDGHSADGKITNMNDNIWSEIQLRGYYIGDDVSQGGAGKAQTRTVFGLHPKLRELKLLKNKHIPDTYLHSSYKQRLDILRGFMDADGQYTKCRKRFSMSTTREWQSQEMVKLVSSLGIKPTVITYDKKVKINNIYRTFKVYDIVFSTDDLNPFLCRNQKGIVYGEQNNRNFKNIVSVKRVESVPTRCIEVESETSTFLYGHTFSVTHNTNKEFNFFDKYKQTLLKPFDHLQNCQYSIYSIQLSVYAYMYEMETGKKCRKIWIGYWDKQLKTFEYVPVMYMRNEAIQLLKLHKSKLDLLND